MSATRRGFLGVAAFAAAWLLRPFQAGGQAAATPTPSPTPAAPPLIAGVARDRYGKFLAGEEAKTLEDRLASMERRSARLRSFKLANGEEPATDFRTLRGPGGAAR